MSNFSIFCPICKKVTGLAATRSGISHQECRKKYVPRETVNKKTISEKDVTKFYKAVQKHLENDNFD